MANVNPINGMYKVILIDGQPFESNTKLTFDETSVSYSGGCNTHGADY